MFSISLIELIALCVVVAATAAESRAAVLALVWASGSEYSGSRLMRVTLLRYLHQSVLWHETYAALRGVLPAYRTSWCAGLTGLVWIAAATTNAVAPMALGVCAGSLSFAVAHGRRFVQYRATMRETALA